MYFFNIKPEKRKGNPQLLKRSQPCPSWPWAPPRPAHPQAHIPTQPWPIPRELLNTEGMGLPLVPPAFLLLDGVVGWALAAGPCIDGPHGTPIAAASQQQNVEQHIGTVEFIPKVFKCSLLFWTRLTKQVIFSLLYQALLYFSYCQVNSLHTKNPVKSKIYFHVSNIQTRLCI